MTSTIMHRKTGVVETIPTKGIKGQLRAMSRLDWYRRTNKKGAGMYYIRVENK